MSRLIPQEDLTGIIFYNENTFDAALLQMIKETFNYENKIDVLFLLNIYGQ